MSEPALQPDFEALLDYLLQARGFDFTGYKRTTLIRRVQKRMQQVGLSSFGDYTDFLQVHAGEFSNLFNTILINVTGFFRDTAAWNFLQSDILPQILADRSGPEPIRIWSAGTASGEEAYSVAILLAELLGPDEFLKLVKIYATDIDEDALAKARIGFSSSELESVEPELRERYFETSGNRFGFRTDLRRAIIFGRHDLLQDAPISRLDLLVCRNTMMYFTAEAQARILARLHYALNDRGYLFLGKAEMLLTQGTLFSPVDLRHRLFAKVPKTGLRDRLLLLTQAGNHEAAGQLARQVRLRELVTEAGHQAQIAIDADGSLALANEQARRQFGLDPGDAGRPLQDLEISYRPLELRSRLDQAYRERRAIEVTGVERTLGDGTVQHLSVQITPLLDTDGSLLGASVAFADVSEYHLLKSDLDRSRQDLETAYEELQSSNEELETTNEELQSTVEELETTNEELQSTNQELETINEELESTNTELQTINSDLNQRSDQLDHVGDFLERVLGSVREGVVVINSDLSVLLWNSGAEELWGLRAAEVVEKPFFNLDIGLPTAELRRIIKSCLASGSPDHVEVVVEAINRRGRRLRCRVVATPVPELNGASSGVVLTMEAASRD